MGIFTCFPPSLGLMMFDSISEVICVLLSAFFVFIFAIVGTSLGAIAGAMVGLKTKGGLLRGAAAGGAVGLIFSTEVFKLSLDLCNSHDCTISCFIPLIETASKLINQCIVQEQELLISSTIQVPAQNDQINTKGLSNDSMQRIPKRRLTEKNIAHALRNGPSCSICLQDFQVGDVVCMLPPCHHTYHQHCISKWFVGHSSCPLCRHNYDDALLHAQMI